MIHGRAYCLLKAESVAKGISIFESRTLDWSGTENPNPFAGWTHAFGLSEFEEELLHSLTSESCRLPVRPVLYEFEGASVDLTEIGETRATPRWQKTKKARRSPKTKRRQVKGKTSRPDGLTQRG